jgi:23S rRNA pseudouridine1911/1915/1917 synthase
VRAVPLGEDHSRHEREHFGADERDVAAMEEPGHQGIAFLCLALGHPVEGGSEIQAADEGNPEGFLAYGAVKCGRLLGVGIYCSFHRWRLRDGRGHPGALFHILPPFSPSSGRSREFLFGTALWSGLLARGALWYAQRVDEAGSLNVESADGERLDRALQRALPDLSRTSIQRLINEGHVRVDGRPARPGQRVGPGERVEWEIGPEPAPSPMEAEAIPLEVVFEDEDLLVINKPRGLVVHPAPGHRTGTLVNAVLAHSGEGAEGMGAVDRPGIVHRLDKDTSGLMVVAKAPRAYESLQRQIADRSAERRYLALVRGSPKWERATVDAPIGRHPTDRKKMAVIRRGSHHTHREALTELRVLERFAGFTLLEARLETGRTHQIRVHCAYIQLPVVGDEAYGPRGVDRDPHLSVEVKAALRALEGQALHAYRLSFEHPISGERLQWLSSPPEDMRRVLDLLGSCWEPTENDPWPGVSVERGA